jgi:hypothetical protein
MYLYVLAMYPTVYMRENPFTRLRQTSAVMHPPPHKGKCKGKAIPVIGRGGR